MPEFLHVVFDLIEKHCPEVFKLGCYSFSRNNIMTKQNSKFSQGGLLLQKKQKKPFVLLSNIVSESSHWVLVDGASIVVIIKVMLR